MDCVRLAMAGMIPAQNEQLVLVLDVSTSMDSTDWPGTRIQGAKDACNALCDEKMRTRSWDSVGIVSFSNDARLELQPVPLKTGLAKLKTTIAHLQTRGQTNIGAGLELAEKVLESVPSPRSMIKQNGLRAWMAASKSPVGRHAAVACGPVEAKRILLLSDGACNFGNISASDVANCLKNNGVEISCIGIGGTPDHVDEALLQDIASFGINETKCYWFIGHRIELIQKFKELANGLRGVS